MSPKRKRLDTWGLRGGRRIILVRERTPAGDRFVAEWYASGKAHRRRFADRASAEYFCERWYRTTPASESPRPAPTLRELFATYVEVQAETRKWRGATILNYGQHVKRILEALGPDTLASAVTVAHMDEMWRRLIALGMAENQVRQKAKLVQRVFAWAQTRELVEHNKPAAFDLPRTAKLEIAEYTPDEAERLLTAWDYRNAWEWRPWAITMIALSHGIRANALLHLRWEDVDMEAGTLTLRAAFDKTRREWTRPLTWEAYSALLTARSHRERLGKEGPWVFYGKGGKPLTYQAYWLALRGAEKRLGITHRKYRAAHGLRRTAVGNVREQTGDLALALMWVGRTDMRDAKAYAKERADELEAIAERREAPPRGEEDAR